MFTKSTYLVKERVGFLKLADVFDIFDADTNQQVAVAMEKPGTLIHILRFLVNKRMLPTTVHISATEDGPPLLSIHRGFTMFRSRVLVTAGDGRSLGYFKSKVFSLGGGFYVYDNADQMVAEIKGDWKGWNFRFLDKSGTELGQVSKKWAGLAKEFFTSADNYIIHVNEGQPQAAMLLLLAAGIAIDTVYKESG
jgi:uncharacterized protein YxjI